MLADVLRFDDAHPLGEPATRPLSGRRNRLAALLRLGMTRCRAPAWGMPDSYALKRYDSATLPASFSTPPSDGFNCCFKVNPA